MLKKHLKKIVSLVLVTMMAIGMSITAIAAEPYQNELEAVMDTSLADSGQVTHYDTTTGEMLVEDGELLTFDEVAIPVPKGSADTPSERGIEIYLVRAGIKKTSGGEFTWYFNVDCPTSPFVKPNIKLTAQLKGSFTTLSGSYSIPQNRQENQRRKDFPTHFKARFDGYVINHSATPSTTAEKP